MITIFVCGVASFVFLFVSGHLLFHHSIKNPSYEVRGLHAMLMAIWLMLMCSTVAILWMLEGFKELLK
jgi:hypothetical protein